MTLHELGFHKCAGVESRVKQILSLGVRPDVGRRMVNRADYALGKAVLLGNQDVALKALRAKNQLADAMKVNFKRYDTKSEGWLANGPEKWIPKRDRSI